MKYGVESNYISGGIFDSKATHSVENLLEHFRRTYLEDAAGKLKPNVQKKFYSEGSKYEGEMN